MIYFLTIFILIILIRVYDFNRTVKGRTTYFYLILLIVILTAGLRFRIGLDTIRYLSHFEDLPNLFNLNWEDFKETRFDPLFYLLFVTSKTIFPDFIFFQLIHALILNTAVFLFIKRNTNYIFSGILLYYIFCFTSFNMEVMRESIAIVFFLIAIESFLNKKWITYFVLVFCAFLFHSAAILLFLIPIFSFLKVSKKLLFYMLGAFLISLILNQYLLPIFQILSFTDSLNEKTNRYLESDLIGQIFNINGIIKNTIIYIISPWFSVNFLKKKYNYASKFEFLIVINIMISIIAINMGLFYRYFNYFILFDIILFAEFAGKFYKYYSQKISPSFSLLLVPTIFSIIISLQFYSYFSPVEKHSYLKTYSRYFPYSSILEKEKNQNRERLFRFYNTY